MHIFSTLNNNDILGISASMENLRQICLTKTQIDIVLFLYFDSQIMVFSNQVHKSQKWIKNPAVEWIPLPKGIATHM